MYAIMAVLVILIGLLEGGKMGCDIHPHFEVKIKGRWHHHSEPDVGRNYELFAKMADVRNYGKEISPICQPKGIPKGISAVTALSLEQWNGDAHSRSWFNAKEIKEIIDYHVKICCGIPEFIPDKQHAKYLELKTEKDNKTKQTSLQIRSAWGWLFGNFWDSFGENQEEFPDKLQDIRLVFWFDN